MQRHLNLIKNEIEETEKRVFPRFPFSFLTFKSDRADQSDFVFEVVDISFTGMQLRLKFGTHEYETNDTISGVIHWKSASLNMKGSVKWISESRLGVHFDEQSDFEKEIHNFLSIDNVISCMRPLHAQASVVDLPSNLRFWLRADGPFEVFVWSHSDNELSKFQIITMEHFIEWEDGKGLKSGRVLSKRDLDTPLMSEDEFVFSIDQGFDLEKLSFAKRIVESVPTEYLTPEVKDFLLLKLGAN
ncbi:PilZ domain-containing protein [Halobacteriovorax sp. GB3]|uniref:PilZ domain-containing protein n=1 Tax=Halobacteriovorax sp. GB3 TaxID=2719615 RepID=UPI002360C252|nr:PilZ domain-containing protein [Halobacteriovorax sp. GB3]MDD0853071.1 PilZ domain-containing protein [Halobacteriovorax sp. GB3]